MDPRKEYNDRWNFFYLITGCGMKIYNTYSCMIGTEIFAKYLQYLVSTSLKWPVERSVKVPMYWEDTSIGDTCTIDFLIGGKIIVEFYMQSSIGEPERNHLKNLMAITHLPYGMVFNLAESQHYCEWYYRDKMTGIIEKITRL